MSSYSVSFPKLGLFFNINPVAFSIGNFEIRWYGIMLALGLVMGMWYVLKVCEKRYGVEEGSLINVIIGGVFGSIIGARLYFVAFSWDQYKDNLWDILNIRKGGIAIYGAIIGAVLVGYFMCKWFKVNFRSMLDLGGLGFLIGQAIGRWGNFFNSEAFGGNTTLPWGMTGDMIASRITNEINATTASIMTVDPNIAVHPTFLYESLWCLLGFLLIHIYSKHRKFDGEIFVMYAGWYGLGRVFIEGLRTDSLFIPNTPIRISQLLAGVMVLTAIVILTIAYIKLKKNPESPLGVLYVNTDKSIEIIRLAREKTAPPKKQTTDTIAGMEQPTEEPNQAEEQIKETEDNKS